MQEEDKDIQRAKWLEEEIDHSQFEAEEYDQLKEIGRVSKNISIPEMDMRGVFDKISNEIGPTKPKVISLRRYLIPSAAAIVILFAFSFLFNQEVAVDTQFGESIVHVLPDNSKVSVSGSSKLIYGDDFKESRDLSLDGEAFFEVEKGQKFTVVTPNGSVEVLGTSFNVFARGNVLSVACKTGKVKVERNNKIFILTPGKSVRLANGQAGEIIPIDTSKIGKWVDGESVFESTPLSDVVESLKSVYGVTINLPKKYREPLFTGSFVHDDLAKASKMVFLPMQIKYKIDNGNRISFVE